MSNLRQRRKALLIKLEATYGTDPTPDSTNDPARAFEIGDINKEFDSQLIRAHDVATYTKAVSGVVFATLNFKIYLTRTSANGTEHMLSRLLKACFWKHSASTVNQFDVIGEPVGAAANSSVTIYAYHDGVVEKIVGARGTATFHIEAGKCPYVEFTMTGEYQSVSAAAMPSITVSNYKEGEIFTAAANTLTIGGSGYHSYMLEFTDGNTVNPIPSCVDTNGVALIGIPETNPNGKVHYLVDTTNAATIEALIDNSTSTAIAYSNSDYANLAVSFNANITGRPIADVEGYTAWDLQFAIIGSVSINVSKPA